MPDSVTINQGKEKKLFPCVEVVKGDGCDRSGVALGNRGPGSVPPIGPSRSLWGHIPG
jgi:hypothetical protein